MTASTLSPAELQRFLEGAFPGSGASFQVVAADSEGCDLVLKVAEHLARPGGTVSGPALMTLCDTAAWLAILAQIGEVALAVTTSLHIDFLRKPPLDQDLVAEGRLLKLGRRLGVVAVSVRPVTGDRAPVAHAQVTYSIPPGATPAA